MGSCINTPVSTPVTTPPTTSVRTSRVKAAHKQENYILVEGYIRSMGYQQSIHCEIIQVLASFHGGFPMLEVRTKETLKAASLYMFSSVVIHKGATLTVEGWDPQKKKGGKLIIHCQSIFMVEQGGEIKMDGLGYRGGSGGEHASCGESVKGMPSVQREYSNNLGGGGTGGGGGGYGTEGGASSGKRINANGGAVYGSIALTEIMLGSGGGGCWREGGNGGGALLIKTRKFTNHGQISVNGGDGVYGGGGGSGGSIFIQCQQFENELGVITAIGGKGGEDEYGSGGNGGFGRIRIKSPNKYLENGTISPNPFIE
eukprot:157321_1